MPEQAVLPHPRTLYAQLRECATPQARAHGALEFLRTCTNSDAGFLFLSQAGELKLAASTHGAEPPPDLLAEVRRSWDRELERQPDDNKTLELSAVEALRAAQESPFWQASTSDQFERRLLSTYRSSNWVPVGFVMLRATERKSIVPIRQVYIETLCSALLDAGDVPERTVSPRVRPA